jgi:predicted transcriptional regulator
MASTTIKVSRELRDRLAAIAEAHRTTLAGAIEKTLEAHADALFWAEVARTMSSPARDALAGEAAAVAGTLSDGLDADEDWSDVW